MGKRRRCYSGIGGQAVLEGIMMKNNTRYSVASPLYFHLRLFFYHITVNLSDSLVIIT